MDSVDTPRHLILGTAGHIDHGKSSLVQALTGIDPDRLAEEKSRGITIQLGFAQLTLPSKTVLGIVDVPGHEKFVRHMIAGSTGIDIALLCIAADDGLMPQTYEHISVLELLGITNVVIALTKIDMVDNDWIEFVSEEIRGALVQTSYADAPICPVSSRTRAGLDELIDTLDTMAAKTTTHQELTFVQYPVDRSFTVKGAGTIVTGTLWSGEVHTDDTLELLPSRTPVRVRSIQVHGSFVDTAQPATRVALNITNVKPSDIHPGDFIATPDYIHPTMFFNAWFTYVGDPDHPRPLKTGSRVHICHGTREVIGRILLFNHKESLAMHESDYVQIRLDEPLPLSWHNKFIARSYSPVHVIGGGSVTHTSPRKSTLLREHDRELLHSLHTSNLSESCLYALSQQDHPTSVTDMVRFAGLPQDAVIQALGNLIAQDKICLIGESSKLIATSFVATKKQLSKDISTMENTLMKFHIANPSQPGLSKTALRDMCFAHMNDDCFNALIQEALHANRVVILHGIVSHPRVSAGAKQGEERAKELIAEALLEAGTTPPSFDEILKSVDADLNLVKRMANTMVKNGTIIRVSPTLQYHVNTYNSLTAVVTDYLTQHGQATAAELKDAMGVSRKYAMPLLEYMDSVYLTVRDGDLRSLGK